MQQQEIHVAQAEPRQALARGAFKFAGRKVRRPDFRRDEHIIAPHSGGVQALPDIALVFINLGGVDMAVTKPQRLLDDARTGPAAQFPGAKANQRNPRSVGLDDRYGSDGVHMCHISPISAPAAG